MPSPASPILSQYVNNPTGQLVIQSIRIGKAEFNNIQVQDRAGALHLQELIQATYDHVERMRRRRRCGTRYPEPLPVATPARLLSVEVEDFLLDKGRQNNRRTTIGAYRKTLDILKLTCGDISIARIDHTHIYQMWEVLRWAPKDFLTNTAYRGLSVEALVRIGQASGRAQPANATLELHRRLLSSFFNTLARARAIPHSPMEAFKPAKEDLIKDTAQADRLLTAADVQKIFSPTTFLPWATKYPHRFWGVWIGLYTGARVNEVAQLKVSDVIQEDGTWCFSIQKTADADLAKSTGQRSRQSLKGASAIRKIPIHPELLKAGFLDYLADIKAFGHPRLFPHLSAGANRMTGESNAHYGQGLVNQFAAYLKGLGFAKGIGFHAFRHTLATELDAKGVREEHIALITGHSVSKKVPVLQESYIHKSQELVRQTQIHALALYRPAVTPTPYVRGQFRARLCKTAKVYP